jgi:hypothetical protein
MDFGTLLQIGSFEGNGTLATFDSLKLNPNGALARYG